MNWWSFRYDERGFCYTGRIALERWDAGDSIWSVEMGGLGPGYEQAIQVLAIECLRELYRVGFWWANPEETDEERGERCKAVLDPVVRRLDESCGGFSGAMVGAAMNLATNLHRKGYREALQDPVVADRLIQISNRWPLARKEKPDGIPDVPRVPKADAADPLPGSA